MFATSYSVELAFSASIWNHIHAEGSSGLVHWISRAQYVHPNPPFYPKTLTVRHGVVDHSSCDWLVKNVFPAKRIFHLYKKA